MKTVKVARTMRDYTTTQLIAKEGWKYLLFTFVLFLLSLSLDFFSWVFFVIFMFTAYMFRNPERLAAEEDELAVLAPSDGTITAISKIAYEDGKEYIRVEIQNSITDVSLLRAPTTLNIKSCQRRHGLFLHKNSILKEKLCEMVKISCESKGNLVHMHLNAGFFSRKIDLYKTIGPLKSTQRFGLLVDGTVELFLPLDTRIKVALGDDILGGQSVLGYFAYKEKNRDE